MKRVWFGLVSAEALPVAAALFGAQGTARSTANGDDVAAISVGDRPKGAAGLCR